MTTSTSKLSAVSEVEEPRCFVCDITVAGRYYTLASCRTLTSQARVIEKLGHLVGERYMVVISEDDIICRSCANLMNTLDRLEREMGNVRDAILKFLEKKYALEDGELSNEKNPGVGQPPQITPSRYSSVSGPNRKTNPKMQSFMCRKRKAAIADIEKERQNGLTTEESEKNDSDSNLWMQCDVCKYTTHFNAFMVHHIRQHVKKKKNPTCDFCGEVVKSGSCPKQCGQKTQEGGGPEVAVLAGPSMTGVEDVKDTVSFTQQQEQEQQSPSKRFKSFESADDGTCDSETVEMIAAEVNSFTNARSETDIQDIVISTVPRSSNVVDNSIRSKGLVSTLLHKSDTDIVMSQVPAIEPEKDPLDCTGLSQDEVTIEVAAMPEQGDPEHSLSESTQVGSLDSSAPTAICVMDMSEESAGEQPTLLTVQKMSEDNSNAVYVQVVEVGKGGEMDDPSNVTKQVLTVSEDGTVEMVEVMWDEMVTPDVQQEQDINF